MSNVVPSAPQQTVSNKNLVLIVYILNLVSYVTGITSLIGVIIAHVQVGNADPLLASHYRFLIRTFWVGLLYIVVGIALCFIFVGVAVLFWWFVWSLIRNIKGIIALNDSRPIANPTSWLFG